MQEAIQLIKEWKRGADTNHVFLSLSGKGFGAESVFVEIYRQLKVKVHVSKEMYAIYRDIDLEIKEALTVLGSETWIHACISSCGKVSHLLNGYFI